MAIGAIMNTATLVQTFDDEFNAFSASPDGSTGLCREILEDRASGKSGQPRPAPGGALRLFRQHVNEPGAV